MLDWGALSGGLASPDGLAGSRCAAARVLRLFTALFLHADWAHLLGNLVFLLIFGLPAERAMGPWRLLVLFLLGGAVANLAAVIAIGTPDRLIIGASGAVSALIGAYLALFPRRQARRGGAAGPVPAVREGAGAAADRRLGAAATGLHLHRPGLRRGGLVGAPGRLRVRRRVRADRAGRHRAADAAASAGSDDRGA